MIRLPLPAHIFVLEIKCFAAAVFKNFFRVIRQIIETRVHREPLRRKETAELPIQPAVPVHRKRADCPQPKRHLRIGQDAREIDFQRRTQPHAGRTRAERIIERKNPRLGLRKGNAAFRAGKMRAEKQIFFAQNVRDHEPVAQFQRRFHGIRQTRRDIFAHDEAIHDDFHRVFFILFQLRDLGNFIHRAVGAEPHIALLLELLNQFFVRSFFCYRDRAQE